MTLSIILIKLWTLVFWSNRSNQSSSLAAVGWGLTENNETFLNKMLRRPKLKFSHACFVFGVRLLHSYHVDQSGIGRKLSYFTVKILGTGDRDRHRITAASRCYTWRKFRGQCGPFQAILRLLGCTESLKNVFFKSHFKTSFFLIPKTKWTSNSPKVAPLKKPFENHHDFYEYTHGNPHDGLTRSTVNWIWGKQKGKKMGFVELAINLAVVLHILLVWG